MSSGPRAGEESVGLGQELLCLPKYVSATVSSLVVTFGKLGQPFPSSLNHLQLKKVFLKYQWVWRTSFIL